MIKLIKLIILLVILIKIKSQVLDKYENALKDACEAVKNAYDSLDADPVACTFWNGCDSSIGLEETCWETYGNEQSECGCSGRKYNRSVANVMIAPLVDETSAEVKKYICSTGDHILAANFDKHLRETPAIAKLFMGSPQGIHRSYPALRWSQEKSAQPINGVSECRIESSTCGPYDPRVRPWYIIASSGPKDVVLILDVSGSMGGSQRLQKMKDAAKIVVKGLTQADYIGMVAFSSSADTFRDTLVPVTADNRPSINAWIDALQADGGTEFSEGFESAFELIKDSRDDGESSYCRTAVIFLTDGENSGDSPIPAINDFTKDEEDMIIFSYTLGGGADSEEPRKIADETGGIYEHIPDSGDLATAMSGYYAHFAQIAKIQNEKVQWTEVYQDFNGLGDTVSPALACYSRQGAKLIGVISGNIKLTGSEKDAILKALSTKDQKCPHTPPSADLTWLWITLPIVLVFAIVCIICVKKNR